MSSAHTSPRPVSSDEPIPGYRLIELVGRGGYGEVWKASAPGGVAKAIKLIFEDQPSRGAMELRALSRIKDVRHPFLLSIDRIEQLPNMLAIVTELADRNLQQHCQTYRDKGLPGIPQPELLLLLRDVAEVLDFIYQDYALQHLDVKAANLLMFGKHLKVGDFGLVKNIFERSPNLAQAMTPAYAAPEIFGGKPAGASDQYSLAIVYQEMLTGTLPFNEVTAARLALQHMHDPPNVKPLPAAQQPVVARALSKNPQQRFPSCTVFIEELAAACRRTETPLSESGPTRDSVPLAQPQSSLELAGRTTRPAEKSGPPPQIRPEVTHVASSEDVLSPTIIIGLGGSGASVMEQLQHRLADRIGLPSSEAFQLLLIDSDTETLNQSLRAYKPAHRIETVATPLLTADEYRTHGQKHRRWLSRRWLFNIPRSLKTDGLRPLGRLALLSHGSRVKQALKTALKSLGAAANLTVGGQRVAGPPRILFVSSISGGTGSGMLLDLAYAARHELQLAGWHQGTVEALLLHSTPLGTERDKAILNAVATLRELAHYGTPGRYYPGEPLLDVPPFHGNNRTFSHVQLMHGGNNLESEAWKQSLDDAAEYAFIRLTTPGHLVGPRERQTEPTGVLKLEAVQVRQIGGYCGPFITELSRQVCVDLIRNWCGQPLQTAPGGRSSQNPTQMIQTMLLDDNQARRQRFVDDAAVKVQTIGVDLEQLVAQARRMLIQELASDERTYLKSIFDQALKSMSKAGSPNHELAGQVLTLQDRAIGLDFGERPQDTSQNTLFDLFHSRLASQAMQLSVKLTNWVHDLVDDSTAGVLAARSSAEAGRHYLRDLIGSLRKEIHVIHKQQIESRISLTSSAQWSEALKGGRWWSSRRAAHFDLLENRLIEHGLACLEELVLVCVQLQLQSIEAQASAVIDKLTCFEHDLKQLERRLVAQKLTPAGTADDAPNGVEQSLRQLLLEHRPLLVQELQRQIDKQVFTGPKKIQRFLVPGSSLDHELWEPLQQHSRQIVLNAMRQVLLILLRHGKPAGDEISLNLDAVVESHLKEPWILGGDQPLERDVIIVPTDESAGQLQRRLRRVRQQVSAISAPTNNITVCRESEPLSVYDAAQQIASGQAALMKLAENLAARTDVAWDPLLSPVAVTPPVDFEALPLGASVSETVYLENAAPES